MANLVDLSRKANGSISTSEPYFRPMVIRVFLSFCFCIHLSFGFSQSNVITGLVIDSSSNEPILFAKIYDIHRKDVYFSGMDGEFAFLPPRNKNELAFYINYTGYLPNIYRFSLPVTDTVWIKVQPIPENDPVSIQPFHLVYVRGKKPNEKLFPSPVYKKYYQYEKKIYRILRKRKA